jgi:hypothetical protein
VRACVVLSPFGTRNFFVSNPIQMMEKEGLISAIGNALLATARRPRTRGVSAEGEFELRRMAWHEITGRENSPPDCFLIRPSNLAKQLTSTK